MSITDPTAAPAAPASPVAAIRNSVVDEEKAQEQMDAVRAELHIDPDVDPLDALLRLDKSPGDITDTFPIPLVDGTPVPWTIRALTGDEIDAIDEEVTTWVKRGRQQGRVQQRDTQRFERMLVAKATIAPDLTDARLRQKYHGAEGEKLVKLVLLPGTYDGLSSKILELSGYTDDLIGAAGN